MNIYIFSIFILYKSSAGWRLQALLHLNMYGKASLTEYVTVLQQVVECSEPFILGTALVPAKSQANKTDSLTSSILDIQTRQNPCSLSPTTRVNNFLNNVLVNSPETQRTWDGQHDFYFKITNYVGLRTLNEPSSWSASLVMLLTGGPTNSSLPH